MPWARDHDGEGLFGQANPSDRADGNRLDRANVTDAVSGAGGPRKKLTARSINSFPS